MKIDIESVENGITACGRIHLRKQAFLPVVPDHRQCMLSKLREPAVESIVSVIISPFQFAAASWTRRIDGDVVKFLVEDRSTFRARESGGHPLMDQFVRQLQKVNHIQGQVPLIEALIEALGLAERSGKPVKDEPPAIAEPFPNDPQRKLVRKKLSLNRPAFSFGADLTSARLFFAEDCTR
jgi:hypothetical protein